MAQPHLETVRRLRIPPLLRIEHPTFARAYEEGLALSLFAVHEVSGPLHDLYLADIFSLARRFGHFDGQHEDSLSTVFGELLGEIHGGVLRTDGTRRLNVSTLVILEDAETVRGYQAARQFYFTQADSDAEWYCTEAYFFERLHELAREYEEYHGDAEAVVRFNLGGILGELSGRLFPWTREEQQALEAESIKELGYVCDLNPRCLAARQFAVQAVS